MAAPRATLLVLAATLAIATSAAQADTTADATAEPVTGTPFDAARLAEVLEAAREAESAGSRYAAFSADLSSGAPYTSAQHEAHARRLLSLRGNDEVPVTATTTTAATATPRRTTPWFSAGMFDGPPCAFQPPPASVDANDPRIAAALKDVETMSAALQKSSAIPGLAIQVVHRGKVLFNNGYGWANQTNNKKVTPDTMFRIGSISKIWTTLTAFHMRDAGLLAFDDPVAKYLPDFKMLDPWASESWVAQDDGTMAPTAPVNPADMTIRSIAAYVSGLPREACLQLSPTLYGCGIMIGDNVTAIFNATATASMILPRNSLTPTYSNMAFSLLGTVMDRIINASKTLPYTGLRDYFEAEIATPMGLTHTGSVIAEADHANFAYSADTPTNDAVRFYDIGFSTPCGGMHSTAHDLGVLLNLMAETYGDTAAPRSIGGGADSSRLAAAANFKYATLREWMQVVTLTGDGSSGYGYGFAHFYARMNLTNTGTGGRWVVTKGGSYIGYSSNVALIPTLGLGVVALGSAGFDGSWGSVPPLLRVAEAVAAVEADAAVSLYNGTYDFSGAVLANVTVMAGDGVNTLPQLAVSFTTSAGVKPFVLLRTGVHGQFFLSDTTKSCMLDQDLVSALAGGGNGNMGTIPADLIQFVFNAAGTQAVGLTLLSKGITLQRQTTAAGQRE